MPSLLAFVQAAFVACMELSEQVDSRRQLPMEVTLGNSHNTLLGRS